MRLPWWIARSGLAWQTLLVRAATNSSHRPYVRF